MGSAIKVRVILGMLQRVRTKRRACREDLNVHRSSAGSAATLSSGQSSCLVAQVGERPVRTLSRIEQRTVTARTTASPLNGPSVRSRAQCGGARRLYVSQERFHFELAGPNDVGLSRKHIVEGLKASLKRLDMVGRTLVRDHALWSSTNRMLVSQHAGNFSSQQTSMTERRCAQEYVDVLYCHTYDTKTPIEETVRLS